MLYPRGIKRYASLFLNSPLSCSLGFLPIDRDYSPKELDINTPQASLTKKLGGCKVTEMYSSGPANLMHLYIKSLMEFCDSMREEPHFQRCQRGASGPTISMNHMRPADASRSTTNPRVIKELHCRHEITGAHWGTTALRTQAFGSFIRFCLCQVLDDEPSCSWICRHGIS